MGLHLFQFHRIGQFHNNALYEPVGEKNRTCQNSLGKNDPIIFHDPAAYEHWAISKPGYHLDGQSNCSQRTGHSRSRTLVASGMAFRIMTNNSPLYGFDG